jgi:hypothetical protein
VFCEILLFCFDLPYICVVVYVNKTSLIFSFEPKNKVLCRNKIKNKKYHTIEIVPKPNRKITERGKIHTHNTQIHDRSLSWLVTGISILHHQTLCIQTEKDWSQVIRAVGYNSLTLSFLHVERTCMTALFYQEGRFGPEPWWLAVKVVYF